MFRILGTVKWCSILLREVMTCPSLESFQNRLEKYISGIIWAELILPLGRVMSWMTS